MPLAPLHKEACEKLCAAVGKHIDDPIDYICINKFGDLFLDDVSTYISTVYDITFEGCRSMICSQIAEEVKL